MDEIKMPLDYQPSKFQCFDGKDNPNQHVAHFIETCNNVGTYNDTMVKPFVCSLKFFAFDVGISSSESSQHASVAPGELSAFQNLLKQRKARKSLLWSTLNAGKTLCLIAKNDIFHRNVCIRHALGITL